MLRNLLNVCRCSVNLRLSLPGRRPTVGLQRQLVIIRRCSVGGTENTEKKMSIFQRFKQMYRDYWYVLIPVHLATSGCWAAGFYYMAITGVDVVSILEKIGISEKYTSRLNDSKMGYYAVTYALYKLATPFRYMVTIGGTTVAIKHLKRLGYIKPANQIIVNTKKRIKINADKIIKEFKDGKDL